MKKKKLSLFLFIDAFGWEIKQRHPEFMEDLILDSKPLETILGYSSACDPSIISGLTPSEHKLWSSYYYDPKNSPFKWTKPLALLPDFIFRCEQIRGPMSKWIKKRCGFTGYFPLCAVPFKDLPLFNYAEKKCIWAAGGLPKGKSIFDLLDQKNIPYYTHNSSYSDETRFDNLRRHIEQRALEFAYCSLGKLDALMHAKGNNHPDIGKLMNGYDQQIRALITTAEKQYDDVSWYLFTDHGMHNITQTHDLIYDIKMLGLKWKKDYVAFYDSTMARFWFFNDSARNAVSHCLKHHPQGRILSDAELRVQGIFFDDHQYGELIFLINSGIQIVPSFMGTKPCKGMHGFDPADSDSKACILSNKPIPESITKIQHIHQLMLNETGLS